MDCQVVKSTRDAFDIALNTSGIGILTHPMYGNFSVKVTEYTKNDNINKLGLYEYNVNFVVELGLIIPTLANISTSVISDLRSQVTGAVTNFVKTGLSRIGI